MALAGEGPCRVDAEFFVLGLGYLVSVGSGEEAYLPDGTRGGGLQGYEGHGLWRPRGTLHVVCMGNCGVICTTLAFDETPLDKVFEA